LRFSQAMPVFDRAALHVDPRFASSTCGVAGIVEGRENGVRVMFFVLGPKAGFRIHSRPEHEQNGAYFHDLTDEPSMRGLHHPMGCRVGRRRNPTT